MTADLTAHPLWPYLLIIAVGFLPTEIWRILAVFLARGLSEDSEILAWVRAVAAALLTGVVANLVLSPTGALASVPLVGRVGGVAVGLVGFFAFRRSVLAGFLLGEAAFVLVAWWAGVA